MVFEPNPAARMFYTHPHDPKPGARGTITSLPTGRGRQTCMPGPRGGLVYVNWDDYGTAGVFANDLRKSRGSKSRPKSKSRSKSKRS